MTDTSELSKRQQDFWGGLSSAGEQEAELLKQRLAERGFIPEKGQAIPLSEVKQILAKLGIRGQFAQGMVAASLLNFASGGNFIAFSFEDGQPVYKAVKE